MSTSVGLATRGLQGSSLGIATRGFEYTGGTPPVIPENFSQTMQEKIKVTEAMTATHSLAPISTVQSTLADELEFGVTLSDVEEG